MHFSKVEWQAKVLEMLQEDPDVTQQERDQIVEYLAKSFPQQAKINVNKATAKDLAEALELLAKDADAIIRYRDKNGSFKIIDDLKKVPGLDAGKIDAHRERLEFGGR
jgi:competence protein ComEA